MRFFGRTPERPPPADVYDGLRRQVLELTPEQLGVADAEILALLMETGYPEAVATLVAVADGTTSLYFSNGGGVIGAGAHESVAAASRRWLELASTLLPQLATVTETPLPAEGETQFVAVVRDELRGVVATEAELGSGDHALSPLFFAGHDVITQLRLAGGG